MHRTSSREPRGRFPLRTGLHLIQNHGQVCSWVFRVLVSLLPNAVHVLGHVLHVNSTHSARCTFLPRVLRTCMTHTSLAPGRCHVRSSVCPENCLHVGSFGRLAEQSPLTGHEPKGFMTAGSGTANTTPRKFCICSTTSDGDF